MYACIDKFSQIPNFFFLMQYCPTLIEYALKMEMNLKVPFYDVETKMQKPCGVFFSHCCAKHVQVKYGRPSCLPQHIERDFSCLDLQSLLSVYIFGSKLDSKFLKFCIILFILIIIFRQRYFCCCNYFFFQIFTKVFSHYDIC